MLTADGQRTACEYPIVLIVMGKQMSIQLTRTVLHIPMHLMFLFQYSTYKFITSITSKNHCKILIRLLGAVHF